MHNTLAAVRERSAAMTAATAADDGMAAGADGGEGATAPDTLQLRRAVNRR